MKCTEYMRWHNSEWLKREESPKVKVDPTRELLVLHWDQAVLALCRGGVIWRAVPDNMTYAIETDRKGNKRVVFIDSSRPHSGLTAWVPTEKDTRTLWVVRPKL